MLAAAVVVGLVVVDVDVDVDVDVGVDVDVDVNVVLVVLAVEVVEVFVIMSRPVVEATRVVTTLVVVAGFCSPELPEPLSPLLAPQIAS